MKAFSKTGVLILLVLALVVTACSQGNGNENAQSGNGDNAGNESPNTQEEGQGESQGQALVKYDPPIQLNAAKVMYGDVQFKEGESLDNNVFDRIIAEELGIEMNYLWSAADDTEFSERMRLSLAANEDLPDFIAVTDPLLFSQLAQSGRYMEIGELFDTYATDVWRDAFEKYPEAWNPVTVDGKRYGIPMFNWVGRNNVMWVREDWLNKLGLQAPSTIAELEAVMDAFVNQDPDENGVKDTYGVALALKNNFFSTWLGSADGIFGAYGVSPVGWFEGEDGLLTEHNATPAYAEPLAKLKEWIGKGYMPADVGLYDEMKAAEVWNAGKAGITFGAYWLSIWPFPDLKANVEGAEFKAYPMPTGPDGQRIVAQASVTAERYLMVRKDYEHPEAVMAYMNFLFENYVTPEPGSKYEWGLAEGYDWAVVDGQPTNNKDLVPGYIDVVRVSIPKDIFLPDDWMAMMRKFTTGGEAETPAEIKQMGGEDEASLHAARIVLEMIDAGYEVPNMAAGAPPTPTRMSKGAMLDKMRNEAISEMLYGNGNLDAFFAEYERAGYGNVRQEMTDWYNSVK